MLSTYKWQNKVCQRNEWTALKKKHKKSPLNSIIWSWNIQKFSFPLSYPTTLVTEKQKDNSSTEPGDNYASSFLPDTNGLALELVEVLAAQRQDVLQINVGHDPRLWRHRAEAVWKYRQGLRHNAYFCWNN